MGKIIPILDIVDNHVENYYFLSIPIKVVYVLCSVCNKFTTFIINIL